MQRFVICLCVHILNMTKYKNKKVCFDYSETVKEIPTHREWTHSERLSVWYTDDDFVMFILAEKYKCLSGSSSQKVEHIQRSKRIENVRYLVLQVYHVQRKIAKKACPQKQEQDKDEVDHSKWSDWCWLAEFYQHHSKHCAIGARQRGLENDLWLIDVKIREASILLNNLTISNNNTSGNNKNDSSANNEQCSAVKRGNYNSNKRSAISSFNDYSPNAVIRNRKLRKVLWKDLNNSKRKKKVIPISSPTPEIVALKSTTTSEIVALKSTILPISGHEEQQDRCSANGRKVDNNRAQERSTAT